MMMRSRLVCSLAQKMLCFLDGAPSCTDADALWQMTQYGKSFHIRCVLKAHVHDRKSGLEGLLKQGMCHSHELGPNLELLGSKKMLFPLKS
jgi:hypothetical protein